MNSILINFGLIFVQTTQNSGIMPPNEGERSRGKPPTTFIDKLMADTGLNNIRDLETAMKDRDYWRQLVNEDMQRLDGRPK